MDVNQARNRPATSLWSWLPATGHGRLRGIVAGAVLATGMTSLAAPPQAVAPKRAAWLLAPQKLEPGDVPAIARGAIDDLPAASLGSTPVARSGKKSADSPAWLTGVDPSVLPASGLVPNRATSEVRTLGSAATLPPLTPSRTASTSNIPPSASSSPKAYVPFPQSSDTSKGERTTGPMLSMTPPAEAQLDPSTPLKGTAANGAPLLAGPPAYRWYGYGTVTPGANSYAPTGQYPKASSNWYSVTGATPGAFPVPVVNPYRSGPGSEPPQYTSAPANAGVPPTAVRVSTVPATASNRPAPRTGVISAPNAGGTPTLPGSTPAMLPLPPQPKPGGVPTMAVPPTTPSLPTARVTPASESVKPFALPEPVGLIPSVDPLPIPEAVRPEPTVILPPVGPVLDVKKPLVGLPVIATKPAGAGEPKAPEALPPALRDDVSWNPTPEPVRVVPPGTWLPSISPPSEPGANNAKPSIVARGQMPDASRPDPVSSLIQAVCTGRADGIDVRWTGNKKLTVCFEVRTQPEATRLVRDVSARPELAPFAIDFCVVVK